MRKYPILDDSGNLALAFPAATINAPLIGSGIEAPVEVLDLDIKSFKVTKNVSLTKVLSSWAACIKLEAQYLPTSFIRHTRFAAIQ